MVYDFDKCVDIFMDINDWTEEEAIDWVEFNVVGAYVGEDTDFCEVEQVMQRIFGPPEPAKQPLSLT